MAAGKEVQFSMFSRPMEPWAGYFDGKNANGKRSLETRSPISASVCSLYKANLGQDWQFLAASC